MSMERLRLEYVVCLDDEERRHFSTAQIMGSNNIAG